MEAFLIDLCIVAFAYAGIVYGYRKGILALIIKPAGKAFRLGASVMLCVPASKFLVFPIVQRGVSPAFAKIVAIVLTFILIMTLGGVIISLLSDVLLTAFDIGLLGRLNRALGALFTFCLSFGFILLFATLLQRIDPTYGGGMIFRTLCRLCDGMEYK